MVTTSAFPLVGEPLALDLANTRVRRNGADVDLLDTPAALTAWLRAERDRLAWTGPVQASDLIAVRNLRDAIDALLHALHTHAHPPAKALECINRILSGPASQLRLSWTAGGPSLGVTGRHSRRSALLHAVASDAVLLLTGPQGEQLRECAHPDCILRFIARNPRRRWCSSAVCGNRARVARHYRREHRAP